MKTAGIILIVFGGIGLIISIIDYANKTDKFNLFGLEVTVSEGNVTPIIVTGIILFIGTVLTLSKRK